jgi:hypothetical protein
MQGDGALLWACEHCRQHDSWYGTCRMFDCLQHRIRLTVQHRVDSTAFYEESSGEA